MTVSRNMGHMVVIKVLFVSCPNQLVQFTCLWKAWRFGLNLCQKDCKSCSIFAFSLQDNVLAAEKPPDIPGLEFSSNDVFITNEDLLFDTVHPYHPWMSTQTEVANGNDIVILEDNPASTHTEIPPKTIAVEMISKTDETSRDSTLIVDSKLFSLFFPPIILCSNITLIVMQGKLGVFRVSLHSC